MTKLRTGKKAHTLSGAAALIIAVFLTLLFTGCPNAHGNKLATPKYTVTFSVDGGGGGILTAKIGETEIKTDTTVEQGKTVTFTATPDKGYKVKGWTLDDNAVNGTAETYTLAVTQSATITVSFEPKKALLTLEAGKNTVKMKAKTADGSAIKVEGCTVTELANDTETTLTAKVAGTQIALIGELTELNCRGSEDANNRSLVALDVSGCTALQKLDCAKNQLTALNVQGLTALQELNCRYNKIAELDVQGLTKLEKLYCQGNPLKALNVSGLTALQELQCNDTNQLETLNVQGCTTLQKLNCRFNKLTALDVSGLTALQELDCQSNQLKTLNVQGLTALQELSCGSNQLKTLNVQGLTALQKLFCENNQLTTLNVQGLTALQELYCENNQLTTLNVQGCTALKSLLCFKNKLNADAFIKIFNDLPIREASDNAEAILYAEDEDLIEDNCTDFTQPEDLKKAFDGAKAKHWKLQKADGFGLGTDI